MTDSKGWISLHRKLLDNPIFKNHKLLQTFLYCLLKATHEDYEALVGDQMVSLKTGQLVTGRKAISQATNLTEQNVRTALSKLEKLGILTIKPTSKYSVITVVAWDSYQQNNQQVTNNQPTSNQQVTTNNNNNNNNNNNKTKAAPVDFSVFNMTDSELSEVKRIRKKNKGGAITQRVANALAKEFQMAMHKGFTIDQILTEWELRGWKSLKAEWLKSEKNTRNESLTIDDSSDWAADFLN